MRDGGKLASIGFAGLLAGVSLSPSGYAAGIVPVEVSSAQGQTVLGSTVVPYKEVTFTAQAPGVVRSVSGEVGSLFSQGNVLVQIDDSQLQAQRNSVIAQINSAQSSIRNAQIQYAREMKSPRQDDIGAMPGFGMPAMFDMMGTRPMAEMFMGGYDKDAIRQSNLSSSASAVYQAQSGLQQAMSQLQGIDVAISNARSIAPFDGMILAKKVEAGDTVQPGQPLITYGYVSKKRLQSDVPSGLVGNLRVGMNVAATIGGSISTPATVAEIYPLADAVRHTVTVKFDLPANVTAPPGTYAEISLPEGQEGVSTLLIPSSALLKGGSLPSVLVVNSEGKSELRSVRLGNARPGNKFEVVSGLTAGDRIIDDPPAGVASGWMPPEN